MVKKKLKQYVIKVKENCFLAKMAYSMAAEPVFEKSDFKTYAEAEAWLKDEKEKRFPSYENMSFNQLSNIIEKNEKDHKAQTVFIRKLKQLKEQMLHTLVTKEGVEPEEAIEQVVRVSGEKAEDIFAKAKDNTLDALFSLEEEKAQERITDMMQYISDSAWEASDEAEYVLECIRKIPGHKVITVNLNSNLESFDVLESGFVGTEKEHENIFLKRIDMGFETSNSFVIRQFIPNVKGLVTMKNGKKVMMSQKAMYSFILTEDGILPMPAKEVEYSFTHDVNGNKKLPEDFFLYKDFSEFLI